MAHVVNIHDLRYGGKPPVLDGISLRLDPGHFMGIVGPNGAGKSTLLLLLAGLIQPDHGHIDLFGQCLKRFNRRTLLRHVGFLPQLPTQQPHLPVRVRDVVAMGMTDYGNPLTPLRRFENAIAAALEMMDIRALANEDYRRLSGGQRQRVRIARALVRMPRLLLLDEPSAALDSQAQERLYRLLRRLCDERGMSIIMVDHDIAAVSSHVDSVACLNRRIHYHAGRGEQIPADVWKLMYGEHVHFMAHDAACIGCSWDNR